jgi:hypothetical protein
LQGDFFFDASSLFSPPNLIPPKNYSYLSILPSFLVVVVGVLLSWKVEASLPVRWVARVLNKF